MVAVYIHPADSLECKLLYFLKIWSSNVTKVYQSNQSIKRCLIIIRKLVILLLDNRRCITERMLWKYIKCREIINWCIMWSLLGGENLDTLFCRSLSERLLCCKALMPWWKIAIFILQFKYHCEWHTVNEFESMICSVNFYGL